MEGLWHPIYRVPTLNPFKVDAGPQTIPIYIGIKPQSRYWPQRYRVLRSAVM